MVPLEDRSWQKGAAACGPGGMHDAARKALAMELEEEKVYQYPRGEIEGQLLLAFSNIRDSHKVTFG